MKKMKKIVALLMATMMIMGLSMTAFAAEATGSITVKNAANVLVAGKTFNAYMILNLELVGEDDSETKDVDERGYVYTIPTGLEDFYEEYFWPETEADESVGGDFDYEVTQKIAAMADDSEELFDFTAKALAAAKAADVTPATKTGAEGAKEVVFDNLPLGYYVIEDTGAATPISALMLDSTNPDVEITLKADQPKIDKNIGDPANPKEFVKFNNTAIGDEVDYVLVSDVPDMTGYTKYFYIVNDTLSKGLTFNNNVEIRLYSHKHTEECYGELSCNNESEDHTHVVGCYEVICTETEDANPQTLAATAYSVTSSTTGKEETAVKIVFNDFIQYKDKAGYDIVITYSAVVNEYAVIGVEGNPNKVTLTYSNNPNVTPEGENEPIGEDPVGITPDSSTRTYVTDLNIIKVDSKENRLEGAEFTLAGDKLNKVIVEKEVFTEDENGTYWKLKDGTYTTEDPNAEGMDQAKYESTTVKYTKGTVKEIITTSETVTATGTVGSDGVLTFTGLSAGEYTITEMKAPTGYNLLDAPIEVTIGWTAPAVGSTDCTWSYTWSVDEDDENEVSGANNIVTVTNFTGVELPETGGMGTTIFYVVGAILLLGSAVLLITRKRMSAE